MYYWTLKEHKNNIIVHRLTDKKMKEKGGPDKFFKTIPDLFTYWHKDPSEVIKSKRRAERKRRKNDSL